MNVKYLFASFAIIVATAVASPSLAAEQAAGAPYAVMASQQAAPLVKVQCWKCTTSDAGWTKCEEIPCP